MIHDSRSPVRKSPTGPIAVRLVDSSRVRRRWRHELAQARPATPALPIIGADDVVLPAFDDRLGEIARRAQAGEAAARDALYAAFEPKLRRHLAIVRPPWAPSGSQGVWDMDDVAQEAYLVFVELVADWHGDVPFTTYLLSRFPWRLRDTIRRGIARPSAPPRHVVIPIADAERFPDDTPRFVEPSPLLDALIGRLRPPLDAILVAHVVQGRTKTDIAATMGVGRRTIVRYWDQIRREARRLLAQRSRHVQ